MDLNSYKILILYVTSLYAKIILKFGFVNENTNEITCQLEMQFSSMNIFIIDLLLTLSKLRYNSYNYLLIFLNLTCYVLFLKFDIFCR